MYYKLAGINVGCSRIGGTGKDAQITAWQVSVLCLAASGELTKQYK